MLEEAIIDALLKSIISADEKTPWSSNKKRKLVLKKINLFMIPVSIQAVNIFHIWISFPTLGCLFFYNLSL